VKPGRRLQVRVIAWVGSLLTFAYIVSVAMTKRPLGLLATFS